MPQGAHDVENVQRPPGPDSCAASLRAIGEIRRKIRPQCGDFGSIHRLKALSGSWKIVKAPGIHHDQRGAAVDLKVTAAGSAVVETLFTGAEDDMMTIVFVEVDSISMTDYFMLHNRPLMRKEKQSDPKKLVLKCDSEENVAIEKQGHMHQVTDTFVDANRVKADWAMFKDGKFDSTHSFEFTRK